MPLSKLHDRTRLYLVNGSCTILAEIALCEAMDSLISKSKKAAYQMPETKNVMPSRSIPLQGKSLSVKSTEAEPRAGVPIKVVETVAKMDPVLTSELEKQNKLERKRNELVGVVKALEKQVPKPATLVKCATPTPDHVKVPAPTAKSGEVAPSTKNGMPSGNIPLQGNSLTVKSREVKPQAGLPIEVVETVAIKIQYQIRSLKSNLN